MDEIASASVYSRVRRMVLGNPKDPHDPRTFHKLSLVAFFAWVGLGADGLSSSCYGPAEAYQVLGNYQHLSIFVALAAIFTIVVIVTSYAQIIELFPAGGGGYVVASSLLSPSVGMVSGCALLIDYVLTISLSIASAADALFSFFPVSWQPHRFWFAVLGIVVLTLLNMRGVKETVLPLIPIFLLFIATHAFAILYAIVMNLGHTGDMVHKAAEEASTAVHSPLGLIGLLLLLLRSYSMGAGTYTGIEAVSNGLPILREPKVKTGKRTMTYMAASLMFMVLGLTLAYILAEVSVEPGKTLNAVMLERISSAWNPAYSHAFVFITLLSEAVILFVAAQAGFLDGPRVLANMAMDRWFPSRFSLLSDRLVTHNGILLMGGAGLATIVVSNASVEYLLVLYSITVFITFVLSQLSMIRHWWQARKSQSQWVKGLCINGIGFVLTSFILVSMVVAKLKSGGWLTLVVTSILIILAVTIKRHYDHTRKLLGRLDSLVAVTTATGDSTRIGASGFGPPKGTYDPEAKTAVLLVNGFNGLGLHTLFAIIRTFGKTFKNFVFVQVGVVDASVFKGAAELENLRTHVDAELDHYVKYANREGLFAAGLSSFGTDVVEEVTKLAPLLLKQYPNAVFFGGQLVFPQDTFFTRLLHNYVIFAVQRRLYNRGIPFIVLPIRA